jgi:hypothetical protein
MKELLALLGMSNISCEDQRIKETSKTMVDQEEVIDDMVKDLPSVLKLTTNIAGTNQSFKISFPQSRHARNTSNMGQIKHLAGFHQSLQNEYNECPVGKYAGPYDRSEKLKLKIQLRKSNLDYDHYSQFVRDKDILCRAFCVKVNYEEIDDLEKLIL